MVENLRKREQKEEQKEERKGKNEQGEREEKEEQNEEKGNLEEINICYIYMASLIKKKNRKRDEPPEKKEDDGDPPKQQLKKSSTVTENVKSLFEWKCENCEKTTHDQTICSSCDLAGWFEADDPKFMMGDDQEKFIWKYKEIIRKVKGIMKPIFKDLDLKIKCHVSYDGDGTKNDGAGGTGGTGGAGGAGGAGDKINYGKVDDDKKTLHIEIELEGKYMWEPTFCPTGCVDDAGAHIKPSANIRIVLSRYCPRQDWRDVGVNYSQDITDDTISEAKMCEGIIQATILHMQVGCWFCGLVPTGSGANNYNKYRGLGSMLYLIYILICSEEDPIIPGDTPFDWGKTLFVREGRLDDTASREGYWQKMGWYTFEDNVCRLTLPSIMGREVILDKIKKMSDEHWGGEGKPEWLNLDPLTKLLLDQRKKLEALLTTNDKNTAQDFHNEYLKQERIDDIWMGSSVNGTKQTGANRFDTRAVAEAEYQTRGYPESEVSSSDGKCEGYQSDSSQSDSSQSDSSLGGRKKRTRKSKKKMRSLSRTRKRKSLFKKKRTKRRKKRKTKRRRTKRRRKK